MELVSGPVSHSHIFRVLVVDDHPLMRAGVRSLIAAEADLDVVGEASNGTHAVELTRELRPDVVLMDISLPELSGVEATRQIVAEVPESRVLALSAHEEPEFARSLLSVGACGYALKRSAGEELVRAVRLVTKGKTYVDPGLGDVVDPLHPPKRSTTKLTSVNLSEREAEVIRLIARGHTSKEMAESLGISPRTLETYKARAMSKLSLRTRADLIRYAMRSGWLRDV